MPQISKPTKIRIVPKEGEIEITLNIHVSVDGVTVSAAPDGHETPGGGDPADDPKVHAIPDFAPSPILKFGRRENG